MNEIEKVVLALDIIGTIVDNNLLTCLDNESDREKAMNILRGSTVMLLNQLGAINEYMEIKLKESFDSHSN